MKQLMWLWKNFVGGKPEYWAFDNPFPVHLDCGDPQTLGEPCGYAIFKPSRSGRPDVTEAEVLRRIAAAKDAETHQAMSLLRQAFDALEATTDSDIDTFEDEQEEAEAVPAQYACRKIIEAMGLLRGAAG